MPSKKVELSSEMFEALKSQFCVTPACEFEKMELLTDLVGAQLFIRTVTYHCVGVVVGILEGDTLLLQSASWVADSGNFSTAIKTGALDEVEPVGPMGVKWNMVVDFFPWNHELPTKQK